jgi:hypothetical protein
VKHTPTDQQQAIIDTVTYHALTGSLDNPTTVTINAVAGSSKSTSLQWTAAYYHKVNPDGTFRYIVFGRLNYEEARVAFGHTAICSTVHQLAYQHMITNGHMKLLTNSNYLCWKDIPKTITQPYGRTAEAFEHIAAFCQEDTISLSTFCLEHSIDKAMTAFLFKLFEAMYAGHMPCTHDIYLKCFHIELVNGHIQLTPTDILAVDEVQDLSPIMLDLVKLYPAKVKVLVGDPYQSIFSFMGCINAFNHFPNAIKLSLSQSFRCSAQLASRVQQFVRTTFDPSFEFTGHTYTNQQLKTKAYLTRTNAALITKMIDYNRLGISYRLSTASKLTQMFEWPLALLRCKPGNIEKNPKFQHIQQAVNEWHREFTNETTQLSKNQYLLDLYPENLDLRAAAILTGRFPGKDIVDAYNHAKDHQNSNAPLSLMTVHTSKGATFDEVELDPDLNESISEVMHTIRLSKDDPEPYQPSPEELESLYIYYVACTRARYSVTNATYL